MNAKEVFFSSQLISDVFRLQLFDPLDEVGLLEAAVAGLVPLVQDLLQVPDLQHLQVDRLDVDGFV